MKIGIDASRAFQKERTGIEEYSYQVIKHLIPLLENDQVVLYVKKSQISSLKYQNFPNKWKIKIINWPRLWTQAGLSLEMLLHPVDVLFIPAHTAPLVHPRKTIVTVHGLEYEFCRQAYSFWARLYMRWSIKSSCRWAKKIIAVSENTKKDLMKLYKVPEEKIEVIYEGYGCQILNAKIKDQNDNVKLKNTLSFRAERSEVEKSNYDSLISIGSLKYTRDDSAPFLLFIGRLEERKNIVGIIKAFEILKEKNKLPHKLVLTGKFGYGAERIRETINNSNFRKDIILPGYVSEEEKWELLEKADVFVFTTFYEGFGLPILEAQSAGCPVVAGNNSSIPEVVCLANPETQSLNLENKSAILVDSKNVQQIAEAVYKLISDNQLKSVIIKKGYENLKRFSWQKCAEEIKELLVK